MGVFSFTCSTQKQTTYYLEGATSEVRADDTDMFTCPRQGCILHLYVIRIHVYQTQPRNTGVYETICGVLTLEDICNMKKYEEVQPMMNE